MSLDAPLPGESLRLSAAPVAASADDGGSGFMAAMATLAEVD